MTRPEPEQRQNPTKSSPNRTNGLRILSRSGPTDQSMGRLPGLAMTVLVVMALVSATGAGTLGPDRQSAHANGTPVLPGAQYAGSVDAQEAEIEAQHRSVAFEVRFENARSNDSKASVVATEEFRRPGTPNIGT